MVQGIDISNKTQLSPDINKEQIVFIWPQNAELVPIGRNYKSQVMAYYIEKNILDSQGFSKLKRLFKTEITTSN